MYLVIERPCWCCSDEEEVLAVCATEERAWEEARMFADDFVERHGGHVSHEPGYGWRHYESEMVWRISGPWGVKE